MGKLCERPGCSDVAAIAYGFDVDRLLVWLVPRDPEGDPLRAGSLCKRHADAMVVPRGWTLDDRREAVPRLFRPAPSEDAPAPKRRRASSSKASRESKESRASRESNASTATAPATPATEPATVPTQPPTPTSPPSPRVEAAAVPAVAPAPAHDELDASRTVAEVTGEPSATDDPDATQAIPWLPTFDADDDLGGVLAAETPLLARAFRGTDRKR